MAAIVFGMLYWLLESCSGHWSLDLHVGMVDGCLHYDATLLWMEPKLQSPTNALQDVHIALVNV